MYRVRVRSARERPAAGRRGAAPFRLGQFVGVGASVQIAPMVPIAVQQVLAPRHVGGILRGLEHGGNGKGIGNDIRSRMRADLLTQGVGINHVRRCPQAL